MIIGCPKCSAQFRLTREALGEGRKVRCAKCGHRWFATPDMLSPVAESMLEAATAEAAATPSGAADSLVAPPPPPPPPPPPQAPARRAPAAERADRPRTVPEPPPIPTEAEVAASQPRVERRATLTIGWLALVVVLVVAIGGALLLRRDIVAAYPAANKLFAAVGLPASTLGYGLTIATPETEQRTDGEDRILKIVGTVRNGTGEVIDVPLMRGAIRNTQGEEIHVWTFRTEEPRVLAGESVGYETEVRNPPRGATGLNITFVTPAEAAAEGLAIP